MQDASAQMAVLQFMLSGMKTTAVPSSIHCDHLIEAFAGADKDVDSAIINNKEIFDFLESAAKKYGIAFWRPGSGRRHFAIVAEYAIWLQLLNGPQVSFTRSCLKTMPLQVN